MKKITYKLCGVCGKNPSKYVGQQNILLVTLELDSKDVQIQQTYHFDCIKNDLPSKPIGKSK